MSAPSKLVLGHFGRPGLAVFLENRVSLWCQRSVRGRYITLKLKCGGIFTTRHSIGKLHGMPKSVFFSTNPNFSVPIPEKFCAGRIAATTSILIAQSPRQPPHGFPQSRFPSPWEVPFDDGPRRQLHRRDGPSSETHRTDITEFPEAERIFSIGRGT